MLYKLSLGCDNVWKYLMALLIGLFEFISSFPTRFVVFVVFGAAAAIIFSTIHFPTSIDNPVFWFGLGCAAVALGAAVVMLADQGDPKVILDTNN